MMFLAAIATTILVTPVFSAPALLPIIKRAGPTKANSYIVKLKPDVSQDSHISQMEEATGPDNCQITYKYGDVFPGYAGILDSAALDYVRKSPQVEYVQADTIYRMEFFEGNTSLATRASSEHESVITRRASDGEGVTIFGIDTGILITHRCFGGRASWGATYGGYQDADGNGHGTHTAGTAVGDQFGVATAAKIVAVKVCSDAGECASSDIISGVKYAADNANGPTVATMSLGGGKDQAIDDAVSGAINQGVHVAIAAGNDNVDASSTSPADVPAANTVGAIDSSDKKASFSNYGSIVDVWALGVNVLSAWIGSDSATNAISGTSMATPRVAGILAVALGEYGQMSPEELSKALKSNAKAVVTGAPSGTTNLKAQVW